MKPVTIRNLYLSLVAFTLTGLVFAEEHHEQVAAHAPVMEHASDPEAPAAKVPQALCGTIENARGNTTILDASRTELVDLIAHAPFACGSWFSVGAQESELTIRLKSGHEMKLGPGTFGQSNADDFTLYRGFVYLSHAGTGGAVRVITPNSKVETAQGKTLVIFSQKREETQVVSLEKTATIENRVRADARKVVVKAGESSSLHFRVDYLDPTTPRPISVAGLKETLADLTIEEEARLEVLHTAFLRSQKTLPDSLNQEVDGTMAKTPVLAEAAPKPGNRFPASVGKPKRRPKSVAKTLGDESITGLEAHELLYPKEKSKLLKELKELRPEAE